jgi:hypothetical protein
VAQARIARSHQLVRLAAGTRVNPRDTDNTKHVVSSDGLTAGDEEPEQKMLRFRAGQECVKAAFNARITQKATYANMKVAFVHNVVDLVVSKAGMAEQGST